MHLLQASVNTMLHGRVETASVITMLCRKPATANTTLRGSVGRALVYLQTACS